MNVLEFEKPIIEISKKIEELELLNKEEPDVNFDDEITKLYEKLNKLKKTTYSKLDAWQKTTIARHPMRFGLLDFVEHATTDFLELHGDRSFADDLSIVGGLAKLDDISVMIIGHQKGRNTKENLIRNFGMPRPEGYRKALRLMKLAEKFGLPVINFIDTPGAFPGLEAEERNQSGAIAVNLMEMSDLKTPLISVVLGEGGSGGALALSVTDVTLMMEHSIYSVISPEGCSSILWKTAEKAKKAAQSLRYTAQDLLGLGVITEIIPEPDGGTHLNHLETSKSVKTAILRKYEKLAKKETHKLVEDRIHRFREMGLSFISKSV